MSAVIKRAPSCRLYFALALAGVLLICLAPARAGEPRLVIHIYKYGELRDTTKLKNFGDFKDILSHKISSISDELSGPVTGLKDLGGLKPFFVVDANDDPANFDGDNDKLAGRWRDAHALEILSGRIQGSAGTFSVKSRVYFGELDTGFNSRFLSIELPIVDEEYDTTRDSHSVAILYALALDAMHRCQPENEVMLLLSAAHERLSDLPAGMAGMELLRRKIQEYLVAPRLCSQGSE
jgi:hypothetical protein